MSRVTTGTTTAASPTASRPPERPPATFEAFWPHYLRAHRSSLNRTVHLLGTGAALSLAGYALYRRRYKLLLLAPLVGYLPAWAGHLLLERNKPATLANPLWALRADLKMLGMTLCGRLGGELERCGAGPRSLSASATSARDVPRDPLPDSTIAMMLDPYRFVSRRCERLGTDVFEARLLLRKTICTRGPEAARLFYDNERMMRKGAMPTRVQATLLGRHGVQTLDDAAHRHRKQMFMSLMTPESVQRMTELADEQWRAHAQRWAASGGQVVLYEQAQQILTRAVCAWAGVPLEESEVVERSRQLSALFDAAGAVGPRHWWSRLNRHRANRWIAALICDVRAGQLDAPPHSPLRAVAQHRELDGSLLTPHDAAVEVLNLLRPTVAVSVYVTFIAHALHEHPRYRQPIADGEEQLAEWFVQEVRRFYPFFPAVFARTRRAFEWRGYRLPSGQRVMLDLHGTNRDPAAWASPDEFRPERFAERTITPYNMVPQGGGDHHAGHRCPGEWIAIGLMNSALRWLTREIRYDVPPQDLRIRFSRLPALPADHFVLSNVRLSPPTEAPGPPLSHAQA